MRAHILKCWPESFGAILSGVKRYEVRKDDRGYMVGDFLRLDEFNPSGVSWLSKIDGWRDGYCASGTMTGRDVWVRVTYKTPGGAWGLPADVCVLGIEPCAEPKEAPDAGR